MGYIRLTICSKYALTIFSKSSGYLKVEFNASTTEIVSEYDQEIPQSQEA